VKYLVEASIAAYRALARLYPPSFRAAFGQEMLTLFSALAHETAREGAAALLALSGRELGGLARGLLREQHAALLERGALALTPMQHILSGTSILFFTLLAGMYIMLDYYAVVSRYPLMTAGTLACGAVLGTLVYWSIPRHQSLIVLALFVAAICCTRAIDWNSRKPFLRALDRIQAGMTVADVDRVMTGYMRAPAARGTIGASGKVVYRHTDEGWGNSDWGMVTYERERVVQVQFLPD
jgi:hypothetical protein